MIDCSVSPATSQRMAERLRNAVAISTPRHRRNGRSQSRHAHRALWRQRRRSEPCDAGTRSDRWLHSPLRLCWQRPAGESGEPGSGGRQLRRCGRSHRPRQHLQLPMQQVVDALQHGAAGSWALEHRSGAMLSDHYRSGSSCHSITRICPSPWKPQKTPVLNCRSPGLSTPRNRT